MYILTKANKVIDYCSEGYLVMGSTVVCESKGITFSDVTVVDIGDTSLPADISFKSYYYIHGSFIPCSPEIIVHNNTEVLPHVINGAILVAFDQ